MDRRACTPKRCVCVWLACVCVCGACVCVFVCVRTCIGRLKKMSQCRSVLLFMLCESGSCLLLGSGGNDVENVIAMGAGRKNQDFNIGVSYLVGRTLLSQLSLLPPLTLSLRSTKAREETKGWFWRMYRRSVFFCTVVQFLYPCRTMSNATLARRTLVFHFFVSMGGARAKSKLHFHQSGICSRRVKTLAQGFWICFSTLPPISNIFQIFRAQHYSFMC